MGNIKSHKPTHISKSVNEVLINNIILPYLCGQDKKFIAYAFRTSSGEDITFEDFKHYIIKEEADDEGLLKILVALGINDPSLQSNYLKNKNLYDLLCHLHRNNHKHLSALIHIIDSAKPKSNLSRLLLPTFILSSLMAITAYLKEYQPNIFNFVASALKKVETLLINTFRHATNGIKALTITSMGVTILTFLYDFISTAKDKKRNLNTKNYDLSFKLAATLLTLTSYAITFASLGAMTVTAGTIFIASSFVSVIKHSISLYHAHKNYASYSEKTIEEIEALPPIEQAQYYRKAYEFRSERDTLILDLGLAVVSTLIIASWSLALFFPPGLVLVAASFGALTAAQTLHSYLFQKRKDHHEDALQSQLRKINIDAKLINAIEQTCDLSLENTSDNAKPYQTLSLTNSERTEPEIEVIKTPLSPPKNPPKLSFHGENRNGLFNEPPSVAEGKGQSISFEEDIEEAPVNKI